jgi:hypothetical protein
VVKEAEEARILEKEEDGAAAADADGTADAASDRADCDVDATADLLHTNEDDMVTAGMTWMTRRRVSQGKLPCTMPTNQ